MVKGIPWNIIGPGGALAVVILIIVFVFLIKYKSKIKSANQTSLSANPLGKNLPCSEHGERIKGCETNIINICEMAKITQEQNRQDHQRIFDKLEDLIGEIHKR